MRVIYFAHPLGAPTPEGVEANRQRAQRWIRWIYDTIDDVAIVADWILTTAILDDFNPAHRARGMAMNKATLVRTDGIWLFGGRISSGMADECDTAREHGVCVHDFTWLGDEPATFDADTHARVLELMAPHNIDRVPAWAP